MPGSERDAPTRARRRLRSAPLSEFPKPLEGHKGAWFAVTSPAAGVYSERRSSGARSSAGFEAAAGLPVQGPAVSKKGCTPGWYEVVGGGFICGNYGTTNLELPDVKFSTVAPNLNEPLPYVYASNAKHGTPLYKTVPSREQMLKYEPYLEKKDVPDGGARTATPRADDGSASGPPRKPRRSRRTRASRSWTRAWPTPASRSSSNDKPWWQQEDIKDRLHEMKLEHLEADSDDILAKRMVKGFYVAVDRTFRWNDRTWYKTTKGLVDARRSLLVSIRLEVPGRGARRRRR